MKDSKAQVLLVEDNLGDTHLIQKALTSLSQSVEIYHVPNGDQAISFLHTKKQENGNKHSLDLIILDLNLPGMDGREVLKEIKTDENLQHIPVVVFTSSEADSDIEKAYKLHANCYVTKPMDLHQFLGCVKEIGDFWLKTVKRLTLV